MRLRLRVDVADRDEAVGLRRRGRPRGRAGRRGSRQAARIPSSVTAAPRTGRARPRALRRARASNRRRSRGRAGRRGRRPRGRPSRPAGAARLVGERPAGAALLLHLGRHGVLGRRARPGRGEYGKTCTFVSRAARTVSSVRSNAASSSAGKPTITSAVRLKSRAAPACVGRSRPCSGAPSPSGRVVAGLERHVQVRADDGRLAQRGDEVVVDVVDLDRGEA